MPKGTIELVFYDGNDEIKERFVRSTVPWGVLKKAIRFAKSVDLDHLNDLSSIPDDMTDELAAIVVMAFGDKFSIDDLDRYVDIGDMITVVRAIIARAESAANPT